MNGETERRVKACLVEGLSNKEIRDHLHLSRSGVNFHIRALYRKYGLYSHADQRRLIVVLVTEKLQQEMGTHDKAERRNGQLVHASFSD